MSSVFSRDDLRLQFAQLDAALIRLHDLGHPEEKLWEAIEQLVHPPSSSIDRRDRLWWWEQLYSTMERHGLSELSRERLCRRANGTVSLLT